MASYNEFLLDLFVHQYLQQINPTLAEIFRADTRTAYLTPSLQKVFYAFKDLKKSTFTTTVTINGRRVKKAAVHIYKLEDDAPSSNEREDAATPVFSTGSSDYTWSSPELTPTKKKFLLEAGLLKEKVVSALSLSSLSLNSSYSDQEQEIPSKAEKRRKSGDESKLRTKVDKDKSGSLKASSSFDEEKRKQEAHNSRMLKLKKIKEIAKKEKKKREEKRRREQSKI
ncbi:hypothetical protein DMN91_005309 [Ooceraea biroi]|uniref:Uncharacterized protein n=1 Tax=Ooceraea biroi TaxID=2015173 RepID=A0A026X0N5_OOCBI|nr:chromatin assembly factor 1 subunit A [Ooceraea biroi]EZA60959.1 hypothetical protein X777_08171 [Ooceraea biroi]RLU23031.1 hypothetical protein DMN91_005309 [Ooceraea biroi]